MQPKSDPGLKMVDFVAQRWLRLPLRCCVTSEVYVHPQFYALLLQPQTRQPFFFLGLEAGFSIVS